MTREITIAAHYNVDSNVVKVQLYVTDECDNLFHPQDVLSGTIQLFNVYTRPETGLEQIALESVDFDKTYANADGFFAIFFINPAVNVNLEARATVEISGQSPPNLEVTTTVLPDEGTFSDSPSTSVVGNAENRSWHTDKEPQRDGQGLDQSPHNIVPLAEDNIVIPEPTIVNSVYADLQFEQLSEVKSDERLPGGLTYLGGGDRLLPKPGVLVFQTIDTPPWELGTSTFVEQAATELLPNNQYLQQAVNGYPSGYDLVNSPGISVISTRLQTLQAEGFDAKAWTLQLNGAVPTSISPFNTAAVGISTPVAFDILKPLSLSILAGMTKDTDTTSITTATLIFTYYDFADRELTSQSQALDVDAMFNARPVKPFSISAKLSDYPPTTEKVTWRLQLGSVEQGDFVTLITSLPSLSQTPFATSQILSGESRVKDNLSFAPDVPFALEEGAVVISMAFGFQGSPREEKYIYDSRSPGTLLNGTALRVDSSGTLTFLIADDTTTVTLTTSTVPNWVSGAISEVVVEWSDTAPLMRISFDGDILETDDTTPLPTNLEGVTTSVVQLGSDANIANHIDSEFIRAVFLKRPR